MSTSFEITQPENWKRVHYGPLQRRKTAIKMLTLAAAGKPNAVGDEARDLAVGYDSDADGTIIKWKSDIITQPTEVAIEAKMAEYKAEYDAAEYSYNRALEYPDVGAQLNKIYDDGITKWKAEMVDPVKTKWPKNNTGPVE